MPVSSPPSLSGDQQSLDSPSGFQFGLRPNFCQNIRNRRQPKRGRKHVFNADIYRLRFACERTFAWIDKFRSILICFDRKAAHFLGKHFVIYTLINLRSILRQ
ncbi:MAG: hypothetical protein IAE89_15340 [Anaerolineae bacterium]|nr:hypothetical protein [Anaerolineae bacterium]